MEIDRFRAFLVSEKERAGIGLPILGGSDRGHAGCLQEAGNPTVIVNCPVRVGDYLAAARLAWFSHDILFSTIIFVLPPCAPGFASVPGQPPQLGCLWVPA